jgi:hypothetical protein
MLRVRLVARCLGPGKGTDTCGCEVLKLIDSVLCRPSGCGVLSSDADGVEFVFVEASDHGAVS